MNKVQMRCKQCGDYFLWLPLTPDLCSTECLDKWCDMLDDILQAAKEGGLEEL